MVVPEEAVTAALVARAEFKNQRGMDNAANLMRHILEAAAPHMLAEAWEAGFQKGSEFDGWSGAVDNYKPDFTNPYRSQA